VSGGLSGWGLGRRLVYAPRAVLFFIDESWQDVGDHSVGALGAVALPMQGYNRFCREFFAVKRQVLGAQQLNESEVRGQHAFTKAAFKRQRLHGDSHWLLMVDKLLRALVRHHARTFVIWTANPEYSSLRTTDAILSKPYRQLLYDLRAFMRNEAPGRLASLTFDQRGLKEDGAVGAAVTNFLVRTQAGWESHFIQTPNFTVSAVSPGLQAADVVAHLAAHFADQTVRPELAPYIDRIKALRYEYQRGPTRRVRCTRQIV
jgi:Protein of unknown function (DUF3800)